MRAIHFFWHILLGAAIVAGFGAAVMLLWNWLVPPIFGLADVGFWQALGLLALARLFFGGAGRLRMQAAMRRRRNPFREKWMKMTSEERMRFLQKRCLHHGFGHDFFHGTNPQKPEQHESE